MKLSDIKKIGVAGGGTMGFGIALNFALWGYPTVIYDLNDRVLDSTRQRIDKALKIFRDEGLLGTKRADDTVKRLSLTTEIAALTDADYVTEAIIERLAEKQQLFRQLDDICQPQTIIASNTSSLLLSDIAQGVKRQHKLVLTHYFDPPHIVPAVEVAKGPATSDETFDLVYNLMLNIKKVPVKINKEIPGYLLNTIQRATKNMAYKLWAEGVASAEDIEKGIVASFGFRSPFEGPMMHYDVSGVWRWPRDIRLKMTERLLSDPELSEEGRAKIKEQIASGDTWFVDPERFEETIELRDREYARRLKDLYWGRVD